MYSDILETQYNKLRKYNILPLKYRHFFRYSTFIYKTLKNNNSKLASRFRINTKQTRSYYILPNMKKDHIKYSFLYIASNLLNSFIADFLLINNKSNFRTMLEKNIVTLYNKSVKFWTKS